MNNSIMNHCVKALLISALLSAAALQVQASQLAERAFALYGDEAQFDVYRRDTPIGEHSLRFSQEDGLLRVDIEMALQIRYLALFSYNYRYQATEWWQDEQLVRLEVNVDDNGTQQVISARREGDQLMVDSENGRLSLESGLITTNHWNRAILDQTRVLNTLTGQVSEIEVETLGQDQVPFGGELVDAMRYRLGGELIDTDTWYDAEGRWMGMEFSATDKSRIRLISSGMEQ
ncbi:DUF6134 family protein [Nitrincola alkalilacustris]|uniref:DUF6134 family protein n=1 Tax=Nitrincola alkalilacustris TaxID=1571224 RepID=UPI00124D6563|nr:DUF6134 family protein [Nitrincola alkalilacustris]